VSGFEKDFRKIRNFIPVRNISREKEKTRDLTSSQRSQ
jgi:hypothetical protein